MAGDDDIRIRAEFEDEVSRPARTAAASIDELGDEAAQTGRQLAMMGESADKAGNDLDQLAAKAQMSEKALAAQKRAAGQARDENGRFAKSVDDSTESIERNTRSIRSNVSWLQRTARWARNLFAIFKVMKWGLIIDSITFLGTAIGGLGAASYAAVAGLSPLVGTLVALPSALLASIQGIGTMVIATRGLGDAMKLLADPEADPAELAAAMKKLTPEARGVARALLDQRKEWSALQRSVSSAFFAGLGKVIRDLAGRYLPILKRGLTATAEELNKVVKYTAEWMQQRSNYKAFSDVMGDNAVIVGNLGVALSEMGRALIHLLNAAGPMMRRMTDDFAQWTTNLADAIQSNKPELTKFFNDAYDLMLRTGDVIGDFSKGLYNIGKLSGSMSGFLGRGIEKMAESFRQWTESAKGQRDIRKWFEDMVPVVRELGRWIRDLFDAAGGWKSDNFVSLSRDLRRQLIPALEAVVEALGGNFIRLITDFARVINKLQKSGALDTLADIFDALIGLVDRLVDVFEALPDEVAATIAVLGALVLVFKKFGGLGLLAGATAGGPRKPGRPTPVVTPHNTSKAPTTSKPPTTATPSARPKGGPPGGIGVPTKVDVPVTPNPKLAPSGWKTWVTRLGAGLKAWVPVTPYNVTVPLQALPDWTLDQKMSDGLAKALGVIKEGAVDTEREWTALVQSIGTLDNATAKLKPPKALEAWKSTMKATGLSAKQMGEVFPKTTQKVQDFKRAVDQRQALKGWVDGLNKGKRAGEGADKSMGGLAKTIKGPFSNSMKNAGKKAGDLAGDMKKVDKPFTTKFTEKGHSGVSKKSNTLKNQMDKLDAPFISKLGEDGYSSTLGKSKNLKGSLDKIPGAYTARVSATGVDGARNAVQGLLGSLNAVRGTYTAVINAVRKGSSFTGNPTHPGFLSTVGELGPEMWIGKSGRMELLGKNGPEDRMFTESGAILPSSLTFDPFGGAAGNAPEWAVKAWQNAAANLMPAGAGRSGDGNLEPLPPISIGPNYFNSEMDVESAVKRAYENYERERKERR